MQPLTSLGISLQESAASLGQPPLRGWLASSRSAAVRVALCWLRPSAGSCAGRQWALGLAPLGPDGHRRVERARFTAAFTPRSMTWPQYPRS
jgi:hypothetical protein